jgi:hypothetical protein
MIYLFDTSAINQLNDDAEKHAIAKGLISTNTIYVTALNVAEALATRDPIRRQSLIQFEKVLAKGDDPILLPTELLRVQCYAHAHNTPRQDLPLFTKDPLILLAYKVLPPSDEQTRELILPWKTDVDNSYDKLFKDSRPHFQSLFSKGTVGRPQSLAKLLRDHYCKEDEFLYGYVSSMYQGASGAELDRNGFRQVLSEIPELLLILLSYAYSIYARAIQEEGYGSKKNPDAVDLWSAIYLPHCDYFVSHDKRQRRALRAMNVYNPRRTEVLSYETLRTRLLFG